MVEEAGPYKVDEAMAAGHACFRLHRDAIAHELGHRWDDAEIEALAWSTWASLHGLVALLIARPEFPWIDRDRLIDLHIRRTMAEF